MDLLNEKVKNIYFKYIGAAFGSTLIVSIYALVDTIAIGQYEGPNGSAAVATYSPLWTLMFAFGLLFGIGGSVLMAQQRGAGKKDEGDKFFTAAIIGALILSAVIFFVYIFFSRQLLIISGAKGEVFDLALRYARWIAYASPLFVMGQTLVPFIRNDNAPLRTTAAVVAGGIFNIFGDIFFVFKCNMGIDGAGLATALGQVITFLTLITYLISKKNKLHFVRKIKNIALLSRLKRIVIMGGSNFVIDIAMGILAVMFNNQVMKYLGASALAVYGVINNVSMMVQTFGYAVGESSQAIISLNFGAGRKDRVKEAFRYAAITSIVLGIICCIVSECFPNVLVDLFMKTTPEVLEISPAIIRKYSFAFILLVFNVFSTYYFQSVMKPRVSVVISLLRGIVLSALFIYVLPVIFGAETIWFAVPLTELSVFWYILFNLKQKEK